MRNDLENLINFIYNSIYNIKFELYLIYNTSRVLCNLLLY